MPLHPGSRLGPYEVLAPLGAGGMGEVWRARDPRLGRDVAIKALPAAFAQDPERLARFEREAKLLASLNHPNVAGIHGVEEVDAARYLVLEFVDGETLETALKRGPLPLAEVLDVARQVAAGVEAAHEAGVVHRDLKPGNVMLTAHGGVKVLDFGLAKGGAGRAASSSDPQLSASPTMTYAATQAGMILGTAAYMSPEQARGKAVDRRTDIWSFGCVLYEMLAGHRVFDGETVSDMVARILEREPDWSALPSGTPPRLVALLKRCMVKDAKQRVRDIGDVRLELEAIAAGDALSADAAPVVATTRGRPAPGWLAGLVLLGAGLGALAILLVPHPTPKPAVLAMLAPPGIVMNADPTSVGLSRDGRMLAFVGTDTTGVSRLWLRNMLDGEVHVLAGTEGVSDVSAPFFSPDGRRVAFFSDGKLKAMSVEGGNADVLADAPLPRGGAWGAGAIVYQPRSVGPLMRIPETGGTPVAVTVVDSAAGHRGHRYPTFLPDGKHFLCTAVPGGEDSRDILLGSLDGAKMRKVLDSGTGVVATMRGWVLFEKGGAVRAQRFDARSLRAVGPTRTVPTLRAISPNSDGAPILTASADGTVLQRAASDLPQHLEWLDRQGRVMGDIGVPEGLYGNPEISPDGRYAATDFAENGSASAILWVIDLQRQTMQRMMFEGSIGHAVWTPDGRRILTGSTLGASDQDICSFDAGTPGSRRTELRTHSPWNHPLDVTPDGRFVVYRHQGTSTRQDLYGFAFGDTVPRPLLATQFAEVCAKFSPDGRWMAYLSDESGQLEVYVRAFPALDRQTRVSVRGGYADPNGGGFGEPRWRADGRELTFLAPDHFTIMSVDVTPGDPPAFGTPRPLFRLPRGAQSYCPTRGLDRFLVAITREETGGSSALVVTDWPAMERALATR